MTKKSKAEAGAEGGLARSEPKRRSSKLNAQRAREMKLLYRLNPGLKLKVDVKVDKPRMFIKLGGLE